MSGCSSVRELTLGDQTIYQVTTRDVFAPCTTTLLEKQDGKFVPLNAAMGAGGVGTVAGPAATAYAGHQIGRGIADSGDVTEISNSSESNPTTNSEANPAASINSVIDSKAYSYSNSESDSKATGIDIDVIKKYPHMKKSLDKYPKKR